MDIWRARCGSMLPDYTSAGAVACSRAGEPAAEPSLVVDECSGTRWSKRGRRGEFLWPPGSQSAVAVGSGPVQRALSGNQDRNCRWRVGLAELRASQSARSASHAGDYELRRRGRHGRHCGEKLAVANQPFLDLAFQLRQPDQRSSPVFARNAISRSIPANTSWWNGNTLYQ